MKEKIRKLFTNVWNVPNALTILRLILVPVFVILFQRGEKMAALAVFCVACVTDALDGFLARKLNQITDFGKLFDPLADKLMVVSALICQGAAGVLPWPAILLVLGKELYMIAGGAFMLSRGVVVSANYFGKSATVCFMAGLILSFFHPEFEAWSVQPDVILIWVSAALAVLAAAVYTAGAWKQLKKKEA